MKKRILMFAIPIMAMALAIPSIVSASSPPGVTASLLRAYNGSDWAGPPTSLVVDTLVTNSSELDKLISSDESRFCSNNTDDENEFHGFVFEIPSCVTHISMLHEGYGTGGHALHVWNGSGYEMVASINLSGPPDRTLTGELTSGFSNYIQNGELNLLAITNNSSIEGSTIMCTDYVRVGTTCPVGGEVLPIGKVSILAPWLGLAGFLAIAMVVVVFVKRRRVA